MPTAYLVPVTVALKCFLILFVNHPKWLQHWDHAEMGLEKWVVGVFFFLGGRGCLGVLFVSFVVLFCLVVFFF